MCRCLHDRLLAITFRVILLMLPGCSRLGTSLQIPLSDMSPYENTIWNIKVKAWGDSICEIEQE
jgi:hypothetical protein